MAWNGRNESILGSKPVVTAAVGDGEAPAAAVAVAGRVGFATGDGPHTHSEGNDATTPSTIVPPPPPTVRPAVVVVNAWSRPLIKPVVWGGAASMTTTPSSNENDGGNAMSSTATTSTCMTPVTTTSVAMTECGQTMGVLNPSSSAVRTTTPLLHTSKNGEKSPAAGTNAGRKEEGKTKFSTVAVVVNQPVSPLGRNGGDTTTSCKPPPTTKTVAAAEEAAEPVIVVDVIPPLPRPPSRPAAWGRKDNILLLRQTHQQQQQQQDEATNSTASSTAGSSLTANSEACTDNVGGNNDTSASARCRLTSTISSFEGNTVVTTTTTATAVAAIMAVGDNVTTIEGASPSPPPCPSEISSSVDQEQPPFEMKKKQVGGGSNNKKKKGGGKYQSPLSSVSISSVSGDCTTAELPSSVRNGSDGGADVPNSGSHKNGGWGTKNYKKNNNNHGVHHPHHHTQHAHQYHHPHYTQSERRGHTVVPSWRSTPRTATTPHSYFRQLPHPHIPMQQPPSVGSTPNNPIPPPPSNYYEKHPMNASAVSFVPAAKRTFDPHKARAIQLAKEAQDLEDRSSYFGSSITIDTGKRIGEEGTVLPILAENNGKKEEEEEEEVKAVENKVTIIDPPFFSIDVECIATGYGSCAKGINDGCGNSGRQVDGVLPQQYNTHSHRYPGRVAMVDSTGAVLANIVIRPPNDGAGVKSYLTDLTGLTRELCLGPDAVPLDDAIRTIQSLLPSDGVIVGQAIGHDVTWLGLTPGVDFDRVVDICDIFRQRLPAVLDQAGKIVKKRAESGVGGGGGSSNTQEFLSMDKSSDEYLGFATRYRHFSLRHVCLNLLGKDIQMGMHDPVIDAQYSLRLFHKYRNSSPTQLRIVRDGLHRAPKTPGFAAEKTPVIDGVCVSAAGYRYKRAARKIWRWYTNLNTSTTTTRDQR